ncbi:family CW-type zinc finger 3 isoform X1 [Podarcis lilfordi]|uniref:Family CW-type zinc finger 3 isoform X1 n=2 Tax=Podarcis lilfordi TaxID=74358 RepID=A0AA35K6C5_9SAUR|nr:family CW-type zinc finger 3 isoform X1 [Podarcis lilfordi]
MASALKENGIPLSALCPKFLHTNSTSHTWPFSAAAELIDNAYDPDVNAKQMWIDKTVINENTCLTFMDNGNGMNADKLHKMLSFGFSDKVALNGRVPVGLYGNGFKSGSMRLGKDAIVFTKNGEIMSVGMLSQTFLEVTKAEHVVVPIITFNKKRELMKREKSAASLKAILEHSLFPTEEELLAELDAIIGKKGTRIIIWNLRREKNEQTEFDFDTDKYDIRIPADLDELTGKRGYKKQERQDQIVPESDYSLRAYCSILYLKPRMQIIIRGQKVQTQLVSKSLAHIERDVYRPKFLAPKTVRITFGFNCRNKDHYGMMMYHRNRLIKAYERVGYQQKANNMGVGVVGIIECNFLKPTHNKQDFDYTNEYRRTMQALGEKLNDYWNEMQAKKLDYPQEEMVEDSQNRPDQTWVQCDSCLKWRKLPDGMDKLPEKWYCSYNPDPQFRNCNVDEEPEDDDLLIPYEKKFKKRDREKLKKRIELSQQIYNEMYLQTTAALSSAPPLLSETIPMFHAEASNVSLTRPQNKSNSTSVSSPHSDPVNSHKRKLSNADAPLPFKITKVTSQAFEKKKQDDDDVIILEENSTPKPDALECDITIVKVEGGADVDFSNIEGEISMNRDACSETNGSKGTAATQTETEELVVKKEETEGNADNQLSRSEHEITLTEHLHISEADIVNADIKINELSLQLLSSNSEKEKYQQQCDTLVKELTLLKQKIMDTNGKHVQKGICPQSTETKSIISDAELKKVKEKSKEEIFILYEQALKEMRTLKQQCDTLQNLKSECSKCKNIENKSEADDMAVQLGDVFRQLDNCSMERDQYKNEIELLEMEKTQLGVQCEQLKAELAELKTNGESMKLRSLRVNVGQLLGTIMPELNVHQINPDIGIVDEILGQVLEQLRESTT